MPLRPSLPLLALLIATPAVAVSNDDAPSISRDTAAILCDRLAGHPDDPDLAQSGIYLEAIDPARAEPACRQAVEENRNERRFVFQLGRVLRAKGDAEAAMALYDQAARRGSTAAMIGLGLFYEEGEGVTQDYAQARKYYEDATAAGSADAWGYLAYLHDHGLAGNPAPDPVEAYRLYEKGALAGDDDGYIRMATLTEYGRGQPQDFARAEALYRRAMESRNPDVVVEAKNDLAWMWARTRQRIPEAEVLVEEAVAGVRADDSWARAAYLDTRAWVRHQLGRNRDALEDMLTVIGMADSVPAYYDRLGDIYAGLGETAKAVAAWKKATELDAPNPIDDPDFSADTIREKIAKAGG